MGFREVSVVEVREVLRAWLEGHGLRTVASRAGVDRKTARRYVAAAEAAGLSRDAGAEGLTDELVGLVLEKVRPARPNGHGQSWEALLAEEEQVRGWVRGVGVDGAAARPVVAGEDRAAAGPSRSGGALPDVAPVRGRSGAASGSVPPRSGSSTGSRGWSARSTSPSSVCSATPRPVGVDGCTC